MSFIAISLALLRVFDIGLSLGFVVFAWPIGAIRVDLGVHRFTTEVLGPIVVVGAPIDILRLQRLTPALFDIKPPTLFVGIRAGESAGMFAESAGFEGVILPW
jgi:hypothetical protein